MVTLEINGTEYDADSRTLTLRDQAGAVSSNSFDILVPDGDEIFTGQAVIVKIDDVTVFRGFISQIDSPTFRTTFEPRRYRIDVRSAESRFQDRIVAESYEDATTTEIVNDLFTKYIEVEGFLLGDVSVIEYGYKTYVADYLKLDDVLRELADVVGASYFIDGQGYFNFIIRDDAMQIAAPEKLTDLQISTDGTKLRTHQLILGASEETSTQTFSYVWLNTQTTMVLEYQVSSVAGITINGNPAGVGILGVDDEDVTKTFLWAFGSQVVSVNPNATTKPAAGNIVAGVYTGYYDIVVEQINDSLQSELALLSGTSGRIDSVYTDETIDRYADAENIANAYLTENSIRDKTVTCVTHELEDSTLYNVWVFNLPDLGLVGNFLIIERTIALFGQSGYKIRVKLSNRRSSSRYGSTLVKKEKKVRPDARVFKNSSIGDTQTSTGVIVFDSAGLLAFPGDGAAVFDTLYQANIYPV